MTLKIYLAELRRGWKTVLLFAAVFLVASLLYCVFLFRPTYVSKSKVLIEEVEPTTFVTELGKDHKLKTNGHDKNAILTQIEILSSHDMAERVYNALISKDELKLPETETSKQNRIARIQKSIKLKNPTATDIIEVTVAWDESSKAYQLAQTVLNEYYRYNVNLNRQSVAQAKTYIQKQLSQSEKELAEIRDQIRNYRKNNSSVDLGTEISNIVKQASDTQHEIANLQSRINYHQGKTSELSSKLNVSPRHLKKVLDSVALGQNESLLALNKDLNEAQQEYAALKVRYPITTKRMSALKESIEAIKAQIQQQVSNTVGGSLAAQENLVIKDSVRTKVVSDLIEHQSEFISLQAEKQSLEQSLAKLKSQQRQIPDQQHALVGLLEREASLAGIVATLNAKLVEANVRESEITSNVSVVQMPTLPHAPSFPTQWHVLAILTATGTLLGCSAVLGRYYLQDKATDPLEVETLLEAPVLGTLSWQTETAYQELPTHSSFPGSSLDYQHLVTALKIKMEDEALNTVGFSSLTHPRGRAQVIANIARMLSNCHYSVLVIDADFRAGVIAREFGLTPEELPDFQELILQNTMGDMEKQDAVMAYEKRLEFPVHHDGLSLEKYMVKLPNEKSLYLMSNGQHGDNAYESVTSKYFPKMIERVKEQFDFVLVDMPSLLHIPDAMIISRFMDGLVVIGGADTSRGRLKAVRKLCNDHSVNLIGSIVKTTDAIAGIA
jgi:polysaccharide biosynthesis transport protein